MCMNTCVAKKSDGVRTYQFMQQNIQFKGQKNMPSNCPMAKHFLIVQPNTTYTYV